MTEDLNFKNPKFEFISDNAKDFIKQALTKEVDDRPTAKDLLNHIWIENR